MIRNLDPSSELFLVDLTRIQDVLDRAQRQITSGLKITSASDEPDQVGEVLQLHTEIARASETNANLGRVKSEVDTAERTLETSARIIERVRVLAAQGAGSTVTAESRTVLAREVQGLLEQLVSASQTLVEGRYVFSGDRDNAPQYQLDATSPTGVSRQFSTAASREIEHPSGARFTVAKTAEEIFDHRNPDDTPAADNVFAAVNALRVALDANDQAGIDTSLSALRVAGDHVNAEQSYYGSVQGKVNEAIDSAGQLEARLRTELSQKRDADVTAAILELERARTHQDAALGSRAQLPRTSLFDYLR